MRLPNSRGFPVSLFFSRPLESSNYHDGNFMPKFDAMMVLAVASVHRPGKLCQVKMACVNKNVRRRSRGG